MLRSLRLLNGAALLWTVAGAGAEAQQAGTGSGVRTLDIDGRRVRARVIGLERRTPGSPVIVFEAGATTPLEIWSDVLPAVAAMAPVVAYDRAGLGGSEWDSLTPTPGHVAMRLRRILDRVGAAPPYILVGYSWGGILARYFAGYHPDEVAGIVFVDPGPIVTQSLEERLVPFDAVGAGQAGYDAYWSSFAALFQRSPPAVRAEFDVFRGLMDLEPADRDLRPIPGVPVVAIVATKYLPFPPALRLPFDTLAHHEADARHRIRLLQDWVLASSRGTLMVTSRSTHLVPREDPDLIVSAVKRVVAAQSPPARVESTLAITNVTAIDGRDSIPRRDVTLIVRGNRVASVEPSGTAIVPTNARVLDGRGKFLIPGLWDMHVHTDVVMGRDVLRLYVENGVTGVRDMAGRLDTLHAWRRDIATGTLVGPRIVASGPYLEGGETPIPHILARTPAEGAAAVDSLVTLGADFVKVHGRIRPETYFSIARRARERDIALTGHIATAIGALAASDSGLRSIEHMLGIPAPCTPAESLALLPRFPAQAALGRCTSLDLAPMYAAFARNGTWVTPTFSAMYEIAQWPRRDLPGDAFAGHLPDTLRRYVLGVFPMPDSIPPGADSVGLAIFAKRQTQVAEMRRAGVSILAGTDAPLRNSPPGFGLHEELHLLTGGGLSNFEALRAATLEPARYLETTDSMGTIAPGQLADLVLLDANPLEDIRNTRRIAAVVFDGRMVREADAARLDTTCSYDRCVLWLQGGRLLRGLDAERVARHGFFRSMPLERFVSGDSARHYALAYERNARRSNVLMNGGLLAIATSLVILRLRDAECTPASFPFPAHCRNDDFANAAAVSLSVGGVATAYAGLPFAFRAQRHHARALMWHNRQFAR